MIGHSPGGVRRALAALAALTGMLLLAPSPILSQSGTIVGRVVVKGANVPLGYTVVSAKPGVGDRFTGDIGRLPVSVAQTFAPVSRLRQ